MPKSKQVGFHEYRYQILPISQVIQMDLEGQIKSIEDLKRKKNEFFRQALEGINVFTYSRGDIRHKKLWAEDHFFIIQLGVERDLKRKTREFEVEAVENWPTVFAAFHNDPEIQKCLVQRHGGFQHTSTVVKILEDNLNAILLRYQLAVAFEPIYEERYFWDIVDRYQGKITQIEFELISPNMSNISASLNFDLGALNRATNTQRTNLQLNSDKNSTLTPSTDDPIVNGLVQYSSKGGGDIVIRAKGIQKKIHTAKGINEINVDEVTVEGSSPEELAKVFKEIMQ